MVIADPAPAPATDGIETEARLVERETALAEREARLRAREHALSEQERTAERRRLAEERAALAASREAARHAQDGRPRPRREATSPRGPQTFEIFYERLAEDGDWIESQQYGFVWQPKVGRRSGWHPYTEGRWTYTDAGWTWVSDERFGWATYHYGRWTRLRGLGWVWVPGDRWAPSWVSWRTSDRYIGWAPLPPEAHLDDARGIQAGADVEYDLGPDQYAFVPVEQLGASSARRVTIETVQNVVIMQETRNVTNITIRQDVIVNEGPLYEEVGRLQAQPIARLRLERRAEFAESAGPTAAIVAGAIAVFAPEIRRAVQPQRPLQVRERVGTVEVDRGWAALRSPQAAEQLRASVRAESPASARATPIVPGPGPVGPAATTTIQSAPPAGATPVPTAPPLAATPTKAPAPTATQPPTAVPLAPTPTKAPAPTASVPSTGVPLAPSPTKAPAPTATLPPTAVPLAPTPTKAPAPTATKAPTAVPLAPTPTKAPASTKEPVTAPRKEPAPAPTADPLVPTPTKGPA